MKKLIRNNKGFTLVELLIAGGIAGGIALVAVTSLRNTRQASNITVVASESSTLKSLIAAQLVNPQGCKKTFPTDTLIVRNNIQIFSSGGAVVVKPGSTFGPAKEFSITDISSSSVPGSNILKLKVDYTLKANLDKVSKKRLYTFTLDLFINKNTAGDKITGCYIDMTGATRKAVAASCKGYEGPPETQSGASYNENDGLYGTCTHDLPEVRNAAGAKVASNLCPPGQYLKNVKSEYNSALPKNTVVLECKTFSVGPCPDWSYVNKVNGTTGAAECVSLAQFYSSGQVLTTLAGRTPTTYVGITLNCPDADQVLRSIRTDGSLECIPKHIETICAANQYVYDIQKIDKNTFQGVCKDFVKLAGCPAGKYLQAAQSDGSPAAVGGCVDQTIPASCGPTEVMIGLNVNGTAKCKVNN
ncbi:prepilin-type N-terminal cleavage/methylation domain-containing protein [Bacteriovorax sp. PP10]|uniref:Prepilin-type N-terminal cleavage/methylation domain-containing protein n=1 Tax=Bacteriovorax antarcticus TaxID=3088717 RepID=A0ABU5VPL1_9BACT|nr:prepilin-type N-terminal cleavage/methylation domain-containing protein [Bacteriovorax sp. PP10]MEA9354982.1 prepilin-type N-terminal cleavage/methylation domain-containing protein [Bacteriovorax sp. PP10]